MIKLTRQGSSSFDKDRIHYEIKGSGKPVLLIHGFTNEGSDWKKKPLYDSLLSNGYKVIITDLRGNGNSDKPRTPGAYGQDAEAKDLIGLMKYLGIEQYAAIGYSRGSIILARLMTMEKKLTASVMGGIGADITNPDWPRRIAIYEALISDTSRAYSGLKQRIQKDGLDRMALAYQQKEQPSTSKDELQRITQRTLVICGESDDDNASAQELHRLIPRSIFKEIPGTHDTAWGTTQFASQILDFFKNNYR